MFNQLGRSSGKLLGFKICEDTTDEEVREIAVIISRTIAEKARIRLLIDIEGFRHMEPEVLQEKLEFVPDRAGGIERVAVLSNRVWIKSWVKIGGPFTYTEIEHFDRSEIEAAWKWLSA